MKLGRNILYIILEAWKLFQIFLIFISIFYEFFKKAWKSVDLDQTEGILS